jgi:hypothetical protein
MFYIKQERDKFVEMSFSLSNNFLILGLSNLGVPVGRHVDFLQK